ncbi:hypothetical protein EON63_11660 [archaeon]|nr:MAG: hypothetical protein EON63_11660 [archaeon]
MCYWILTELLTCVLPIPVLIHSHAPILTHTYKNIHPYTQVVIYGGEYFDGEAVTVYSDVYRWNIDKSEWRHIQSLNTPPPRCAHQVCVVVGACTIYYTPYTIHHIPYTIYHIPYTTGGVRARPHLHVRGRVCHH